MSSASATTGHFGKQAQDQTGARFPHIGETNFRVINLIKEMYAEAAVVFGRWISTPENPVSDKTAKRKLKFERTLDIEELGILIRSERGYEILGAVMGDARPAWWRLIAPLMDAADARKMQLAARRRVEKTIESALDADRDLSAAIARLDTLAFHGQDQAGVQSDALRTVNRVPNSPVAQKRGRK